jgi:very-short-patch-repair endonuclease
MSFQKPKSIEKSCYKYKETWSPVNDLLPEQVTIGSNNKIWFICFVCNHEYQQSPKSKSTKGSGCRYCVNNLRCGNCNMCLDNSCFRYKNIWSDKNKEKCEQIAISSNKKFLFNCDICSHDYQQAPSNKLYRGSGCPYCNNKLRCGNCDHCLKNSCFRYKELWSDKNKENCEKIALSCHKKFLFNCDTCNHEYEQSPNDKTHRGSGCPYCNNKLRCGDCEHCLKNSCFRYKEIWSDKNKENCGEIALQSNKKFLFNCDTCKHEYEQSPNDKTNKGQDCPFCINKNELKVANFLKEQRIKFKRQFSFENIKKYYDFYLPDFNLILEIDGDQHFRQVSNWVCSDVTMNNDIEKMKTGLEKSISFLRIYQPDIWEDKIDWKTVILKNLYKRTLPDITYVSSKTDIYDSHKNQPYEEIR